MVRWRIGGAFVAVLLLSVPGSVRAQVPAAELRAAIFMRAVAYERGVAAETGPLNVLVVRGASGDSARDGQQVEAALRGLASRQRVGGREIVVEGQPFSSAANVLAAAERSDASVIYLARGLTEHVGAIAAAAGRARRILLCGDPEGVGRGCVLSVEANGDRARIVIHLRLATAIGLRFDARLLQLSRVVR